MPCFELHVREIGRQMRRIDLMSPIVVGRETKADLRIHNDDCVSRQHLRLAPTEDGAEVEVLGSTNTTTLDGRVVQAGAKLRVRVGAIIKIGGTVLVLKHKEMESTNLMPRVVVQREAVVAPKVELDAAAEQSCAWIIVKGSGNRSRRSCRIVGSELCVGSDPACGYCVQDVSVSAKHALLRYDGTGWQAKDLCSVDGTRVDGRRLGEASVRLQRNSLLVFGRVQAIFVCREDRSDAGVARAEDLALRRLAKRGRLTAQEVELIAKRIAGRQGDYAAAILMHETDVTPADWVAALSAPPDKDRKRGALRRLAQWFQSGEA
jgi:pSer/pThr/pTyr-binding forkhead associated (FHA) protein